MSIEDKKHELKQAKIWKNKRTICEVHREIYDILAEFYKDSSHFDELVTKLEESYVMAKKMDKKLRQYKFDYSDDWWEIMADEVCKEKLDKRKKRQQNG